MADKHTKEQRRKNMQAVKSSGSKIETVLAKAMCARGLRYRKQYKGITGKPDFAFISLRIAVFCDSEFWHGKDWKTKKNEIKSNRDFWIKKIEGNIERDRKVNRELAAAGWLVLRYWGRDIQKDLVNCVQEIEQAIAERKNDKQSKKNQRRKDRQNSKSTEVG
ncbi:MAG: very short patch repair endonuclease [Candidatus Kapabacteria bacterium]|nr:very short patch repair endonuclease [Candidatus Kapabacteria bacterium]